MPGERTHEVARASEVAPDSMIRVVIDGTPICLVHAQDGGFYAIDDTCTHEEYSLSEGELFGFEVECPAHGSRFDVRSGAVRNLPATRPVRTHRVHLEGDDVTIEVR